MTFQSFPVSYYTENIYAFFVGIHLIIMDLHWYITIIYVYKYICTCVFILNIYIKHISIYIGDTVSCI